MYIPDRNRCIRTVIRKGGCGGGWVQKVVSRHETDRAGVPRHNLEARQIKIIILVSLPPRTLEVFLSQELMEPEIQEICMGSPFSAKVVCARYCCLCDLQNQIYTEKQLFPRKRWAISGISVQGLGKRVYELDPTLSKIYPPADVDLDGIVVGDVGRLSTISHDQEQTPQ